MALAILAFSLYFMTLGMVIPARTAMIAMAIMISVSVKPCGVKMRFIDDGLYCLGSGFNGSTIYGFGFTVHGSRFNGSTV
jgi:hypothetical protein